MFNCSCCGTDVTSPYFYNNGVYGWTCIKKINPSVKKNKAKSKCAEVKVIDVEFNDESSTRGQALISIDDVRSIVTAYRDYNDGVFSDFIEVGNFKFNNGKWFTFINS